MVSAFWNLISLVAAIALLWRARKYFLSFPTNPNCPLAEFPLVSIIVPARNEERNITRLLTSLKKLNYPKLEIIVVDDESTDNTATLAQREGVRVLSAGKKPSGWLGKTWACHVGASNATGALLLFTDADTFHYRDSLSRTVGFLLATRSQMISAPAFHANASWWEKWIGPFHCMMHLGASPFDPVSQDNPYALGQYLLIERGTYYAVGGHAAISTCAGDDAALARKVLRAAHRYQVYNESPVCEVQMYNSPREFLNGWERIIRLGMTELKGKDAVIRTLAPFFVFNLWTLSDPNLLGVSAVLLTLTAFAMMQRRIGKFNSLGVLATPLSLLLFVILALSATFANMFNLPAVWRGRSVSLNTTS